ncbi:MAG: LLM class F420-dependent oxidoreductase [Dehalococcoidia bacterium]|nr:LLM class F420-dependent oxidoreductase [Dehalococcoidia bacterium]MCB9484496.1 LLM class F420-dependent oxidoreductase [Thermoflexaceae bacterium]
MKLALSIGYAGAQMSVPVEHVQHADRLGYDSVWTGEAYGSDAMTPLAYLAGFTSRIRLATGIIQLAARTPANAAMQAATIDGMSNGRFICGIGVSGPQIVEGWYGQPWGNPTERIRDYVAIMKKIFAREAPVTHDGSEISLPYTGPGSSGLAKPLRPILHMRPDLPIWLGSFTPANLRLAGEIADGLTGSFVPGELPRVRASIQQGFDKAGNGKSFKDFELFSSASVVVTNDVKAALDSIKPHRALYIGGMGARTKNFHNDRMVKRGYPEAAARVQELFLAGRKDEAAAAIPDEFIDEEAIVGPPDRIRERFRAWADAGENGLDGLKITAWQPEALELMADLAGTRESLGR